MRNVSFVVDRGERVALVGESGSGKSLTALSIVGLLPRGARIADGAILLDGTDLVTAPGTVLREIRGKTVGYVFQNPTSSLDPLVRIGAQVRETLQAHRRGDRKSRDKTAVQVLDRVGIHDAETRMKDFPHQFSGGMRQRAMIAGALAADPSVLIADEPTTALDVTVQAQILDLMRDLQREFGSAIIMITHDLGVVAEMADEILVMYGGKAVEHGNVNDVFYEPQHPYAWGLLTSMPRLDRARKERLDPVPGNPPSLINIPSGCAFHPRCGYRSEVPGAACRTVVPDLEDSGGEHLVRCHIPAPRRRELFESDVKPRL